MKLLHVVNISIFTFNRELKEKKKKLDSRAKPDLQFFSLTLEGVQHPDFRIVSPITDTYFNTQSFLFEIKHQKLIVWLVTFNMLKCHENIDFPFLSFSLFQFFFLAIFIYVLMNFHTSDLI